MPYCIQCGKELADGAKFCFHCGAAVPNAQTTPAPQPIDPPVPQTVVTPQPAPTITPESISAPPTQKKKRNGWKILGWSLCVAIPLTIIFAIVMGIYSTTPKYQVKSFAKREVADFWQDWDEDMELVSITYDSIKADELDEDEIAAIIAEEGNWGYTDIDGNEYDTHWDYWEEIGYDPYEDTYTVYTIRGDYHVTDNRKADYEGWYCVTLLHRENAPWQTLETEMEMPDDLKQYLPD